MRKIIYKPLVTIGIPTYNRADSFLRETLESALAQTYDNLEILVSDNQSADDTEVVIKSYKDDRIRYVKQDKNLGALKNMSYCLEAAKGEYFQMLHDDDLIDPEFVETCMKAVQYSPDKGIIIAGSREIDENGTLKYEKENPCSGMSFDDFMISWYERKLHLFFCSILFNTDKLRKIGGFKEEYHFFVDVAAEFELAAKSERVDVPEVLGSFRAHGGSWGKSTVLADWCDDSKKLLDLACSLAKNKEKEKKLREVGLETSAERMYRYATYRTNSHLNRISAYFTVWSKFNYQYLPPRKYVISWIPFTRFILMPRSSLKLLFKNSA